MQYRNVEVQGRPVQLGEAGEGVPVVFLHGNPDTHTVWSALVTRLQGSCRCLTPDLPGFGASAGGDDVDVSLSGMSRWVGAFLDAAGFAKVHLVVHDIGSTYGLAFAAEHAERLETLTTFNGNFFPDYRWHFWARAWRTRLLGEIVMALGNEWLFVRETRKGSPGMSVEHAKAAYAAFTPATRRHVLRMYREMDPAKLAGWDERLLRTIAVVPTLVLWGDLDPYIPATTADRYGGELHHFANAGHWPMVDLPDEVAAHIAKHVAAR
jgi:pimeloyl-ACP methyl ester carboxylesterase